MPLKRPYRPRRASTTSSPPSPSSVRRHATEREFGTPIKLVVLFRAPPPIVMVAGTMWIDPTLTREVTVIGALGDFNANAAHKMLAIRRRHAWVAYTDQRDVEAVKFANVVTTGPLDPRERDITWAWGWKSKAAKALRVLEALR